MIPSPIFSVITPTFNRPDGLARLLRALAAQECSPELFEIIVVDDGSHMDLSPLLRQYESGPALTIVRQQNQGPAAARNHGALVAKGQCLVFIDDDCEPLPGWLGNIHKAWLARPAAIGGGPINDGPQGNRYSKSCLLLQEYLNQSYNPIDNAGGFFTTNNLWVPSKGFLEVGGFDAGMKYAEDRELCYRWSCNKGEFQFVPEAKVIHHKKLNLLSFWDMHFHYGQGTALFRVISAQKKLPKVKINSPKWYLDLLLYGVRKKHGLEGVLLSALTAASQAAYLAGIIWGKIRKAGPRREMEVSPG